MFALQLLHNSWFFATGMTLGVSMPSDRQKELCRVTDDGHVIVVALRSPAVCVSPTLAALV